MGERGGRCREMWWRQIMVGGFVKAYCGGRQKKSLNDWRAMSSRSAIRSGTSARFRAAKNWTILDLCFQLFAVLGGFFQVVRGFSSCELVKSKTFVHKLATRRKKSVNGHDRMLLIGL